MWECRKFIEEFRNHENDNINYDYFNDLLHKTKLFHIHMQLNNYHLTYNDGI